MLQIHATKHAMSILNIYMTLIAHTMRLKTTLTTSLIIHKTRTKSIKSSIITTTLMERISSITISLVRILTTMSM
jgi:hypothetical protein